MQWRKYAADTVLILILIVCCCSFVKKFPDHASTTRFSKLFKRNCILSDLIESNKY